MYFFAEFRFFCALLVMTVAFPAGAFELVLAKVSGDAEKGIKQLTPILQHVARNLSEHGVTSGSVRLYHSRDALTKAINNGDVHWVTETGFNAAKIVQSTGAKAIALKWKKGKASYRSILFSRSDSNVNTLSDLVGRTIVFEDEGSFSSYYLPRLVLERQGLVLHKLSSLHDKRVNDAVNYVFARTEKNIALWVDKGLVDAGALSSDDWESPKRLLPGTKARMNQLFVSDLYPRAYELVSPSLPGNIRQALTDELTRMNQSDHKALLDAYEKTSRFELISQTQLEQLDAISKASEAW